MVFSILLLTGFGSFAWVTWKYPRIAYALFFALLPTYLIRFSIGPLPTTFLEVCFWILFGAWVIREWRALVNEARSKTFLVLTGIFALLSVTSLVAVPREHFFSSLGLWRAFLLEPALLAWMCWHIFSDRTLRVQSFLSLAMSAFLLAVLGIFQYTTGLGIPAPWDVERRITSVFDYPNALGLFLAPVLGALLVFGISTWKQRLRPERIFIVGSSITLAIGIVLAKTEAALIAIPAALFVAFFVSPKTAKKQKIAAGVLAMIVGVSSLGVAPVREKLLLQDFSGLVRQSQWSETLLLLRDHPFTGAGLGYYPEMLRAYHTDWQYEIFQDPHNIFLNVWIELGLLGVFGMVLTMGFVAKKVWEQRNDALVLAAGTALLVMCVHGLVDVPFFKNDLAMMTVFFIALILAPHERMR